MNQPKIKATVVDGGEKEISKEQYENLPVARKNLYTHQWQQWRSGWADCQDRKHEVVGHVRFIYRLKSAYQLVEAEKEGKVKTIYDAFIEPIEPTTPIVTGSEESPVKFNAQKYLLDMKLNDLVITHPSIKAPQLVYVSDIMEFYAAEKLQQQKQQSKDEVVAIIEARVMYLKSQLVDVISDKARDMHHQKLDELTDLLANINKK